MAENPFPTISASNPIATALLEFAMSGDNNTIQGAIHQHQATLVAIAGAIGRLETELAELKSQISES